MKTDNAFQRYFREYLYYRTVEKARTETGQVIPISQARAIKARIAQRMGSRVSSFLSLVDEEMASAIPGYQHQFGDHTAADPECQRIWKDFLRQTGAAATGSWKTPVLPISPYDSRWADRSSVKRAGTALTYLPDATIAKVTAGDLTDLHAAEHGGMQLWKVSRDDQKKMTRAGPAMTDEDASGLTALMNRMSAGEYENVREWVIAGARDPRTGQVDRSRFMGRAAVQRSIAVLEELQRQGIAYEVRRDLHPGQIKAWITGTGTDIRLIDTAANQRYAGARVYDNGVVIYYSTSHRTGNGKTAFYLPTPAECVDLVRVAQGRPVARRDGSGLHIGEAGTHDEQAWDGRARGYRSVPIQDSYHSGKTSSFTVKDYDGPGARDGEKVMIYRNGTNRGLARYFSNPEAATEYLRDAVETARDTISASLDVDGLIAHLDAQLARGASADELDPPGFSSIPEIAEIQRSYWDVLTGARAELMRPGATMAMYEQRIGQIGALDGHDSVIDYGNLVYGGSLTPSQKIREHAEDALDELIGTWEPQPRKVDGDVADQLVDQFVDQFVDQRFDPVRVARYMTSETGQWANMDSLAAAMRRCGIQPGELMGSGFNNSRIKDKLIVFDPRTAVPVAEHGSAFIRRLGARVHAAIGRNGCIARSVEIDQRGVIRWTAEKLSQKGTANCEVTGEIGQIFDVGAYGEIVTDFAGGENMLIVPGYEARISAQRPGETRSVEERTLLRGYEQLMSEQIDYQIAGDLLTGRSETGEGASLNRVYSRLYGTTHPVDFIERARSSPAPHQMTAGTPEPGTLDRWTEAIVKTEARRVRYANDVKENSTVHAAYSSGRAGVDPADDNRFDAWRLTDGRNMAVLTGTDRYGNAAPGGYFDPVMTGGAKNQGIVRYLTEGAEVAPDGRIRPSTHDDDRAPLMKRPELAACRFDPFDRQQMTASSLMQSSEVTEPAGVALMTFGGWTADDPIVISRRFAERHQIRGANGEPRDLAVGDKLSDLHGNKGVISLVVDPEMDPVEATRQQLSEEVAWFRANPDMDVVMSPFSLISRRNAGAARELLADETGPLVTPFTGSARKDGLGRMRFIVTHMAVDEKTKVYDDEAVQQGTGRKASSQLAWALGARDCTAIMTEFYGHNTAAEANLREMMLSVGLDMEADGTLRVINRQANGPDTDRTPVVGHGAVDERPARRLFPMPELIRTSAGSVNTMAMRRGFGALIGDKGGDLEIPWPLTYPTGETCEKASDTTWKMPVLSSHLRSGQEFEDGTTVGHDYTSRYLDIYEESFKYRDAVERLGEASKQRAALKRRMEAHAPGSAQYRAAETELSKAGDRLAALIKIRDTAQRNAQLKFDSITNDLASRVFTGKKNIFRDGLMSARLPDSATAVWTADPRLDVDQVAMGPAMAAALGLIEGDHALIWRDPILRDSGVRYLRVAIDERLTGVAINPVMDKCFDGDFDGDSVAVVKLHTEAAQREAMDKFSVAANLLDQGVVSERGTHPFAMQVALDTQVALSKRAELRDELDALSSAADLIEAGASWEPAVMTRARREELVGRLSDFYRDAQRGEFGAALGFTDTAAHLKSVDDVCVRTGAKGNAKKLADYTRYLGVSETGEDLGEPGITRDDQEASMYATAVKAFGTGLAGSFSQRAVKALRNTELKAVLELTYPVTQSVLQAKHDAAEARHKYEVLMGPGRDLWRGRLLEHDEKGWRPVIENGGPVQATTAEWEKQFAEFYSSADGFNTDGVNLDYVHRVAVALSRNGRMLDLEEDRAVEGSLMDRMAYGGDLPELITAADGHQNLFDGKWNEQFCSRGTRRQRALAAEEFASLAAFDELDTADLADIADIVELHQRTIEPAVVKHDVLADHEQAARARGSARRSVHAVTLPLLPVPDAPAGDDPEMGM